MALAAAVFLFGSNFTLALGNKSHVAAAPSPGASPLASLHHPAPVLVDPAEFPGVLHAATNFASDVQQVTGDAPAILPSIPVRDRDIVLIGTIGHSPVLDRLIAEHKLDVSAIRGHWEMSITRIGDHPMRGIRRALVIAGADKRGTIFGIYEGASRP